MDTGMLAGEMVKRTEHAQVSRETVRRRPKENQLKPWQQNMWCIPHVDGTYVARQILSGRWSALMRARPS
jgi:hypothetical protein